MCDASIKSKGRIGYDCLKQCDKKSLYRLTAKKTTTRSGKPIVLEVCKTHMKSLTLKDDAELKWEVQLL